MPRKKRAPPRNTATRPKPPTNKTPRDAALVLRMVNACEEAMLLRMSKDNICRLLGEVAQPNGPPVPPRTADDYIARVKRRWEAEQPATSRELKKDFVRRQFAHIRRAVQKGNLSAVYHHEKMLGDVGGVFAPLRVEASTPPGQPIEVSIRDPRKMTSAERRKRLAELEAKRQVTLAAVAVAKPEAAGQ